MKNHFFLFLLLIIISAGCASTKTVKHWTGIKFEKADYYHDLDGNEISEFKYGQELFYFEHRPYIVEGENGMIHGYMSKWEKTLSVKENYFTRLISSASLPIADSTNTIKVIYIKHIPEAFTEEKFYSIFEDDDLSGIYLVLHKDLSVEQYEWFPHKTYHDKDDVLLNHFPENDYSDYYIQLNRNEPSSSYVGEGGNNYLIGIDEYLARRGMLSSSTFLLEEKEISKKQFVDYYRTHEYRRVNYSKDNKEYVMLYASERQDTIDHNKIISLLEKSTDRIINRDDPLCILYLENHFDNEGLFGAKLKLHQDFRKVVKEFPQYQFLTIIDKDLKQDRKKLSFLKGPKRVRDRHGVIDKYISFFETESINWIVILPNGAVRIRYGHIGDYIKMIEEMEE